MVTERLGEIDARGINSIPLFRDDAGRDVVVRVGRYGPYLQRLLADAPEGEDGDRATVPDGPRPDELTPEKVDGAVPRRRAASASSASTRRPASRSC